MNFYKSKVNIDGLEKTVVAFTYKEEQKVEQEKEVDQLHHIHILDRSGSMTGLISQLVENVKQTFDMMAEEDLISVIWFSGENQCETLLKGASKRDADKVKKLLDTIKSTIGITCFSRPLQETNKVIDDLAVLCPNFSVTLFTDGEPVTNWSLQEEENRIFKEIEKMKDKIIALNCIGYGYYYNRDLLMKMSEKSMFGKTIHSSQINEYAEIFSHNYTLLVDMVAERVTVNSKGNDILYLTDKSMKLTSNEINLDFLAKKKNQFFIICDNDNGSIFINDVEYFINDINKEIQQSTLTNFLYAYAHELYYKGATDTALQIIATLIRDKFLVDELTKTFTSDERQNYAKFLSRAALNRKPGYRMKTGEAPIGYIPKDDAFCIMDLLKILQVGDNYYQPVNDYNRIGLKTTDEYNMFEANKGYKALASFEDLVFNQKHLNLSIRYIVDGFVKLNPKEAKSVGLDSKIASRIYRNQTIIKDGNLNVPRFNAYLDQETYLKLSVMEEMKDAMKFISKEVINGKDFDVVEIDLTYLPVINRMYAKNSDNINHVLNTVYQINELKAKQKVVNYYIKDMVKSSDEIKAQGAFEEFTPEQIRVLEAHGLNNKLDYQGIDNKKAEKSEEDYYISRLLEFTLKGWSSLPKVEDVEAKMNSGKALKDTETVMAALIDELKSNGLTTATKENKQQLDNIKKNIKDALTVLTIDLNIIRLAKVLTNSWWAGLEVDSKGNYTYEDCGKTLIIKSEKVKVFY